MWRFSLGKNCPAPRQFRRPEPRAGAQSPKESWMNLECGRQAFPGWACCDTNQDTQAYLLDPGALKLCSLQRGMGSACRGDTSPSWSRGPEFGSGVLNSDGPILHIPIIAIISRQQDDTCHYAGLELEIAHISGLVWFGVRVQEWTWRSRASMHGFRSFVSHTNPQASSVPRYGVYRLARLRITISTKLSESWCLDPEECFHCATCERRYLALW